jgi:hypothetical protein
MSPTTPRRLAWPLAAAIPLLLAAAAAPVAEPGLMYDFTMKTTATQDGRSRDVVSMSGRGQVTRAGDARVDLADASGGGPMVSKGGYIIVQGGTRMLMVNPEEKHYFSFNLEQMMAGMGSLLQATGGLVRMQMSDVKVDVADLGAGGTMQGYATRHMRLTQSYTLTMSVLGRRNATTSADTIDYWIAPELKHVVNPFLRMGGAAAAMLDFGNPDFQAQMRAANEKLAIGLPLKSVTRSASTDDKGKTTSTTGTMEVTNVRTADIPAETFVVPAGYTEVEMPYAQLAALGDSLAAARRAAGADTVETPSAGEAAKKAAEEGAKKSAASRLRGLIRKP